MVDAATRLTVGDILLLILGILLPPLPVLIKRGCGCQFLLNIVLCIIGLWIGGTPPPLSSQASLHQEVL
jgi:uncharacterized membrane protein YqaE (UPF0057 family)